MKNKAIWIEIQILPNDIFRFKKDKKLNYKETLYFIAKCLTIFLEDKNRQEIEKQLKSKSIDWDAIVKVSTSHYVFPALYCNLKRVDFLHYLPEELFSYMEYITNINRGRNEQIINQAKELNTLLLANNITPIFLKGTGNLLAGLYEDIAERMVGDIDFLFSKEDYPKVISVLTKNRYSFVDKIPYELDFRHYPRLKKEDNIAAVEIHKQVIDIKKNTHEFNFSFLNKDSQLINGFAVLSYVNKLNLSIISNQINDNGFLYKTMPLRNAYDVFLLSKKTNAKAAVNMLDKLTNPLNCFLAACYEVFNKVDSLEYNPTIEVDSYLRDFKLYILNNERKNMRYIKFYITVNSWLFILYKSIFHKGYRFYIFKCIIDKNWYTQKLIQLGIKK